MLLVFCVDTPIHDSRLHLLALRGASCVDWASTKVKVKVRIRAPKAKFKILNLSHPGQKSWIHEGTSYPYIKRSMLATRK